jgi:tyrosinase
MPASSNAATIWRLLTLPMASLRKDFQQNPQSLPEQGGEPLLVFSPFAPEHSQRAAAIRAMLNTYLARSGEETVNLADALSFFESLIGKENPDLLFYGLRLFLTRYPGSETFVVPSLLRREAERMVPAAAGGELGLAFAVGSEEEAKLDWFRESPFLNEHHEHWHFVYDTQMNIDRQGEMFFYMHQQMLARYDAERFAEQVSLVAPFDDFRQPIKVGYAPGPDERLATAILGFRRREPNERIVANNANAQQVRLKAIRKDIDDGYYDPTGDSMQDETQSANRLGSTIESNVNADADFTRSYAGYHGWGHMRIHEVNRGVMGSTVFAIREVVFWEWHKGIDDLYFRLQERSQPYDFSVDAPPVLLRKGLDNDDRPYSMDLILVSGADIPSADEGSALGAAAFGGSRWNEDFEEGLLNYSHNGTTHSIRTTQTLRTKVKTGTIAYTGGNGQPRQYPYDYLVHDPFGFFVRVENTSLEIKRVTIRVFMVPTALAEDRRKWIELDKFLQELPPTSKSVIFRRDLHSSVIAKPAIEDPTTHYTQFDPTNIPPESDCDCGWPYQMLLPKGTKTAEGMECLLMVMISDGELDEVAGDRDCGSLSFCAARSDAYPDRRPLGYPFNRKFANTIADTIRSNDHMACRTIFIKNN